MTDPRLEPKDEIDFEERENDLNCAADEQMDLEREDVF